MRTLKLHRLIIVVSLMLFVSALSFYKVKVANATAPNPYWWVDNNNSFSQYDDYQYKNGRTHQGTYYSGTIAQLSPTPGVDSNILSTNASYDGVTANGPRWGDQGVSDVYAYFTSDASSTQEDEWQCAELVKRFLFLEYGARSIAASGSQVVDNYSSTTLGYPTMFKKVANDSTNTTNQIYPKAGDILSYSSVGGDAGHTALVQSVTGASGGSATIMLIEQNASSSGLTYQNFQNWQFQNGIDNSSNDSHTVSGWLTTTAAHKTWTNEGNMAYQQYQDTVPLPSVLLPDGKVLIAGGYYTSTGTNHTQIYTDGSGGTGSWASKANMSTDRKYYNLQVVTVSGGGTRVLAAGGASDTNHGILNTAELYNESNNTWTATPNMKQGRAEYASSILSDGRVLVTGGVSDSNGTNKLSATEIYDPVANTWTAKASMSAARSYHQQITFTDNNGNSKVMVIGGVSQSGTRLTSTEIYDPSSDTWTAGPSLSYGRWTFSAVLMNDGRILVVGGEGSNYTHSEVYNPATNTWTTYTTPYTIGTRVASVLLGQGANYRVLTAIGAYSGSTNVIVFDPSANSWSTTTSMNTVRADFALSALSNGNVLAAGGQNSAILNKSEEYTP